MGCPEAADHMRITADDLATAMEAAREDRALHDDEAVAFRIVRAGMPAISDADAIRVYRDAEREVRAELSRPEVWAQVDAVAAALLERQYLSGDQVRAIIACNPPVGAGPSASVVG